MLFNGSNLLQCFYFSAMVPPGDILFPRQSEVMMENTELLEMQPDPGRFAKQKLGGFHGGTPGSSIYRWDFLV